MQGYPLRFVTVSNIASCCFIALSQHTEPTGEMAAGYDERYLPGTIMTLYCESDMADIRVRSYQNGSLRPGLVPCNKASDCGSA